MYTTATMYTTMHIGMAQIGVPSPVSLLETGESVLKKLLNGETVNNFLFFFWGGSFVEELRI